MLGVREEVWVRMYRKEGGGLRGFSHRTTGVSFPPRYRTWFGFVATTRIESRITVWSVGGVQTWGGEHVHLALGICVVVGGRKSV